jgi:hypothetical protein
LILFRTRAKDRPKDYFYRGLERRELKAYEWRIIDFKVGREVGLVLEEDLEGKLRYCF